MTSNTTHNNNNGALLRGPTATTSTGMTMMSTGTGNNQISRTPSTYTTATAAAATYSNNSSSTAADILREELRRAREETRQEKDRAEKDREALEKKYDVAVRRARQRASRITTLEKQVDSLTATIGARETLLEQASGALTKLKQERDDLLMDNRRARSAAHKLHLAIQDNFSLGPATYAENRLLALQGSFVGLERALVPVITDRTQSRTEIEALRLRVADLEKEVVRYHLKMEVQSPCQRLRRRRRGGRRRRP